MNDRIRAKAKLIYNLRTYPILPIEPDEVEILEIVARERQHYTGLSRWLEFYELGRTELYQELFFTPLVGLKPFADRSLATKAFCQQLWTRSEWAQRTESPEVLWMALEHSISQARLRKAWLTGTPYINDRGRIKGKVELAQHSSASVAIFTKALNLGLTVPEIFTAMMEELLAVEEVTPNQLEKQLKALSYKGDDLDPMLYMHTYSIAEGVNLAAGDDDMEHFCRQYLKAISHFNRIVKDSGNTYEIIYLDGLYGGLRVAEKSKKMPKPQGLGKRGRGRPPKGQERKM